MPFLWCYFDYFSLLQAFCDPLQGFVNAILFVFLSKALCCRLLDCSQSLVCRVCCCWCSRRKVNIQDLNQQEEDERPLVRIIKNKKLLKNGVMVSGNHHGDHCNGGKDMFLYGSLTTKEGWELVHVTNQN